MLWKKLGTELRFSSAYHSGRPDSSRRFTGRLSEELSAKTEQVGISFFQLAYKNDVNRPMLSKGGSNHSKWCMVRGLRLTIRGKRSDQSFGLGPTWFKRKKSNFFSYSFVLHTYEALNSLSVNKEGY